MDKTRISAVRYSNTYPFIYGLRESGIDLNAIINIDHPADCADKIALKKADIGLIPVAAIPSIPGLKIIGDYCIGTKGPVRTVLLLSNKPINEIKSIRLDYRSRTSVALTKILAREYWKIDFKWKETSPDFNFSCINDDEGLVLIGDQCYDLESQFNFKIDLAEEWKQFTSLPFVFACWVTNKKLDQKFIDNFNSSLRYGVENIDSAIEWYKNSSLMSEDVLRDYLNNNIDFILDEEKRMAMNIFFKYLEETNKNE